MFDEAQPGMTAPPGADDSMGETAEDLTAPAVQEPPFSSADLQEPSPSPAQDASTTMGTHPTEVFIYSIPITSFEVLHRGRFALVAAFRYWPLDIGQW